MIIIFIFHIRQTLLETWKKEIFFFMSLFNLKCLSLGNVFFFFKIQNEIKTKEQHFPNQHIFQFDLLLDTLN